MNLDQYFVIGHLGYRVIHVLKFVEITVPGQDHGFHAVG